MSKLNIDFNLLKEIDKVTLSERASKLKDFYNASVPGLAGERATITMNSWKESTGKPLALRWSRMFRDIMEGVPTPIFRGQKIAGNITKYFRGAYPHSEVDGRYLDELIDMTNRTTTMGGMVEIGNIEEEDLKAIVECGEFFRGRAPGDVATALVDELMGDWYEEYLKNGVYRTEAVYIGDAAEPTLWDRLIKKGMRDFIDEIDARVQRATEEKEADSEKFFFWQAAKMEFEAVITYAHRYAAEARRLAAIETEDLVWKKDLEEIGEMLDWVPENPARTFKEGVQCMVIFATALGHMHGTGSFGGWGRADQNLYHLFKNDLAAGRIDVTEAVDILSDLFLFGARIELHTDALAREHFQRNLYTNIGTCGRFRDGTDASNELSYLFLHTTGLCKYAGANVTVGWHKDIAPWIMDKAFETMIKYGGGQPQLHNVDNFARIAMERGYSREDATEFHVSGCSQISTKNSMMILTASYINVPMCLDMALHNGVVHKSGSKMGVVTGDPRKFETFEDLMKAWEAQTEFVMKKQMWHDKIVDKVRGHYCRCAMRTCMNVGGIENGVDAEIGGGGMFYGFNVQKDRGLVDTADSLVAIKKLVYDEKLVTMDELLDAIDNNFEGTARREEIQALCLAAPKFGNEISEVDEIICRIGKFTDAIIEAEPTPFGSTYVPNRNGQGWHLMGGKPLGALANGRKSGQPLADGSISPEQGMDVNGPTAVLNSVLAADFHEPVAEIFTLKFPANLFKTQEMRDKGCGMLHSFMERGGSFVQTNIVDAETLLAAKKEPKKYRDVVVRVGGYSAYFVNLSPEIQDEIIARTAHTF